MTRSSRSAAFVRAAFVQAVARLLAIGCALATAGAGGACGVAPNAAPGPLASGGASAPRPVGSASAAPDEGRPMHSYNTRYANSGRNSRVDAREVRPQTITMVMRRSPMARTSPPVNRAAITQFVVLAPDGSAGVVEELARVQWFPPAADAEKPRPAAGSLFRLESDSCWTGGGLFRRVDGAYVDARLIGPIGHALAAWTDGEQWVAVAQRKSDERNHGPMAHSVRVARLDAALREVWTFAEEGEGKAAIADDGRTVLAMESGTLITIGLDAAKDALDNSCGLPHESEDSFEPGQRPGENSRGLPREANNGFELGPGPGENSAPGPADVRRARLSDAPYDLSILESGGALLVAQPPRGSKLEGSFVPTEDPMRLRQWSTRLDVVGIDGVGGPRGTVEWAARQPPIEGGGGRIYLAGDGLAAFDGDSLAWEQPPTGERVFATAFENGSLAVARGHHLGVIDRTGRELSGVDVPEDEVIRTPPAISGDGGVWVATDAAVYVAR